MLSPILEIAIFAVGTTNNRKGMNQIETAKAHGWNVLQYAAANEKLFTDNYANMGKERKTTFFSDLSIAEWFGNSAVYETNTEVLASWGGNIEYITEYCICLNHKIWQHYKDNKILAKIYNDLWEQCEQFILDRFQNDQDALNYYYEMTD